MSARRLAWNAVRWLASVGLAYLGVFGATALWGYGWHHSLNAAVGAGAMIVAMWWRE